LFERFTDRARRAVVRAQEESRLLNHTHIGTEHLLLGLLGDEKSIAGKALRSSGVSLETARAKVEELVQASPTPLGHIPFTPRAKKVMELSLRESMELGSSAIDTGHMLLGLIRQGEGVAIEVLGKLGVDPDTLREETLELIGAPGEAGARSPDCPGCGSDLRRTIAYRDVAVAAATDEDSFRAASLVYCTECGMTLGVLPSDA
jgi:ATP-dependent Clp protease ATP-binding subunit ClpC